MDSLIEQLYSSFNNNHVWAQVCSFFQNSLFLHLKFIKFTNKQYCNLKV